MRSMQQENFMTTQKDFDEAGSRAVEMIKEAGIRLTQQEESSIVVTDFELGDIGKEGAQILEWVSTERVCVRLIALLPCSDSSGALSQSVENGSRKRRDHSGSHPARSTYTFRYRQCRERGRYRKAVKNSTGYAMK